MFGCARQGPKSPTVYLNNCDVPSSQSYNILAYQYISWLYSGTSPASGLKLVCKLLVVRKSKRHTLHPGHAKRNPKIDIYTTYRYRNRYIVEGGYISRTQGTLRSAKLMWHAFDWSQQNRLCVGFWGISLIKSATYPSTRVSPSAKTDRLGGLQILKSYILFSNT